MEWESKTTSWNLSKLEMQDNSHQLVALAGTSGSGTENMFSVDLKLGGLGNTGEVSMDTLKQSRGLAMASSQGSGSAKRGRGAHNGGAQAVSCLVDGCTSDLSNCREYHRRHRVCERHSKTPVVLIGGAEQRFCQQCSRFHSLAEFDEVKRSCRKRLDGHNRRRRKTQPEAVFMPSGVIGRNHTGSGLIQFSSPYIHASSTTAGSVVWPTGSAQSQRPSYFPNSSCSYSSYNIGRGDNKQIQFMPSGLESRPLPAVNTSAICQQLLDQQHGGSSQKIAPNGFFQPLNLECALSLLSSNQMQSPVDGMMCVSHLERSNAAAASSPLLSQQRTGTCLHFSDLGQHSSLHGVEDENHPAASLIPTTKDGHGYDAIHSARHDGLSDNGPPRFFPFSWQ